MKRSSICIVILLAVVLGVSGMVFGQGRRGDGRRHDRGRYENRDRGRDRHYHRPSYRNRRAYRRYPGRYSPSVVIVVGRIPIIISQQPVYRNRRYEHRTVINLSGRNALVRIDRWPYRLDDREFLYPGESMKISVPVGVPYDIDASVMINGRWYQVDVESGYGSDLIIPPVN